MYLLGISFLQQGAPELVVGGRVKHDKLISHRGQTIVDNDIQPLIVLPELQHKNGNWASDSSHQSSKYELKIHHCVMQPVW